MNFFKSIKQKAINLKNYDTNQQQKKQQKQQKPVNSSQKQTKFGNLVNTIYSKFKEQNKNQKDETRKENDDEQILTVTVNKNIGQGIIWCTAASTIPVTVLSAPKKTTVEPKDQSSAPKSMSQPQPQLQVTLQQSATFIQNLQRATQQAQKSQMQRISKARNWIFNPIQLQPIYLLQNSEHKILKMELYSPNVELITQRLGILDKEVYSIDAAIKNALFSGYLWQAHGMDNVNLFQVGFQSINKGIASMDFLVNRLSQQRQKISFFLKYHNKILQLNRKRLKIAKKLKLLTKIKSYKKDICLESQNIDQAFYIERNRQKVYTNLLLSQKLLSKVLLLQKFKQKIQNQNIKLINMIGAYLNSWIDKNINLQNKHVQKLLILLYFIKNQNMYIQHNLNAKINVKINSLQNKGLFVQKINEVMAWQDYKYVNDASVKAKVHEFLSMLVKDLGGQPGVGRMSKKNKCLEVGLISDIQTTLKIDNLASPITKLKSITPIKQKVNSPNKVPKDQINDRNNNFNPANNTNQNDVRGSSSNIDPNTIPSASGTKLQDIISKQQKKIKQKLQNGILF